MRAFSFCNVTVRSWYASVIQALLAVCPRGYGHRSLIAARARLPILPPASMAKGHSPGSSLYFWNLASSPRLAAIPPVVADPAAMAAVRVGSTIVTSAQTLWPRGPSHLTSSLEPEALEGWISIDASPGRPRSAMRRN